MKKFLFTASAGLICFLFSCNNADNTKTTDTTTTEKNKTHSRDVYDAIETGDVSKLDSFMSKDIVDHSGMNGDIQGRDSVKANLARIHEMFKDIKIDIISEASNGDYAFTLVHFAGTTTVPMHDMPANTKVDHRGVDVVRLKDGMGVEHWRFIDEAEMMKMMNAGGDKMGSKMDDKMKSKMDTSKTKKY
jgi:predicted SnoaL-like aldol condensation-catalyzing enzyme